MSISRLQQMAALGADWWNDSCDLRELGAAVALGAVGATSNPVIVTAALAEDRAHWIPVLDRLIRDHPAETEDQLAWRLIAQVGREAAALLQPVFQRTGGEKGYLSMQVNSQYYPSRDRMLEQGIFLAGLAPNIAIKAPAIDSGIAAMEEMTAGGIRVNATVSFTVAQAVACAEAIERGLKRAPKAAELRPYVTIMIGRVDDLMKRVQQKERTDIDPAYLDWAGIAVFRRAARIFRERGYRATLLCAAYRHEGHWAEIVGPDVLQSIPAKWWKQFDASAREVRVTIDDPVDAKIVAALSSKFPEFRAAYDEKGLTPAQFVHYGASIHTLTQFLGGYQQLLEIVRSRMLSLTIAPLPTSIVHFIAGEWTALQQEPSSPVYNPSTGEVIGLVALGGAAEVDAAVQAAAAAFPGWAATPVVDRARILHRYRALLEKHFDEITKLISREHGKTLAESRGDLFRGLEMVEYASGAPALLMGEVLPNVARGIDCEAVRHPLGVCVGITPFNFPAMIPLWMFPIALVCGNAFVLKPSERVPFTAVRLAELLAEAGLPPGVFNLVHGGKACVEALLTHPLVKAVSFVGSTPIARLIHQTASQHGKRVQANGGAKNYVIIMPDADVGKTVEGLMNAAFGCAGERCMAGSTAVTVGDRGRRVLPELVQAARSLSVGRTDLERQPGMGPVITAAHRDRVQELIASGEKDGARVIADGRGVKVSDSPRGFFLGATVIEDVQDGMRINREEVFGPVLNVMHRDDLGAAIDLANRSAFGNGAVIFTRSGATAREFKERVKSGMIGVNIGVPASLAMFPFSGWNDSFFGDLHMQGREGFWFYTQQKVVTTRWFAAGEGDIWKQ